MKKLILLFTLTLSMMAGSLTAQAEIAPSCQRLLSAAWDKTTEALGIEKRGQKQAVAEIKTRDYFFSVNSRAEKPSSIERGFDHLLTKRNRFEGMSGVFYELLLKYHRNKLARYLRKTKSEYANKYNETTARAEFFVSPRTYERKDQLEAQLSSSPSNQELQTELNEINEQLQAAEAEYRQLIQLFQNLEDNVKNRMLKNAVLFAEWDLLLQTQEKLKNFKAVRVHIPTVTTEGKVTYVVDSYTDDRFNLERLKLKIRKIKDQLKGVSLYLLSTDYVSEQEKAFAEASRKLNIYAHRLQTHNRAQSLDEELEDELQELNKILENPKFMVDAKYEIILLRELIKDEKKLYKDAKKGIELKAEGKIFDVIDKVFGEQESQKMLDNLGINKYKDIGKKLLSAAQRKFINWALIGVGATTGVTSLAAFGEEIGTSVWGWASDNAAYISEKVELERRLGYRESATVKRFAEIKDNDELQKQIIQFLRTHFPNVAEDMEDGSFDQRHTEEAYKWQHFILALNVQRYRNMLLEEQIKFDKAEDEKHYAHQMILIKEILGEAKMDQVEKVFIAIIEESTTVDNSLSDELKGIKGKTFEAASKNFLHKKYPDLTGSEKAMISKALANLNVMDAINLTNADLKADVNELISYRSRVIQYGNSVSNPDYEHFALILIGY